MAVRNDGMVGVTTRVEDERTIELRDWPRSGQPRQAESHSAVDYGQIRTVQPWPGAGRDQGGGDSLVPCRYREQQ